MADEEFTMADFERAINAGCKQMLPGDIVTGTVIGISDTEVTVDLNAYAEGIIKIDELSNDPRFSIKGDVHIGDEISAVVLREDRKGNILLSTKQADDILAWDKLRTMMEEKSVATVKVAEATNAGVVTYLEGIRAFIPASKLALEYVENTEEYVGKTLNVIVVNVDEENKKLVLSAKDILRQQEIDDRNSRIAMLPIGTVVEGVVDRMEQYGAFVTIGKGLQGLVHVSQICEKRIKSPKEVLELGQKVNVKIIDTRDGKISLSIKAVDEKEEVEEAIEEVPAATYSFGDDEPSTMASLFKNIKLK
ncbi:MAG: S1 RNA-binding domain-containing protein [Lachnospiraceae bacterium]|nr:S1 RNA-binding domain-containing protein [Lachnospiraceae bacterium]